MTNDGLKTKARKLWSEAKELNLMFSKIFQQRRPCTKG